jgi:O-antigen/teichoic acid export membrane protein
VLVNLLIKPVWLITENLVQDTIGHEQYGTFAALYALGYLFMTFADLGMNMFTTKKLAGEPEILRDNFSTVITLKILLGLTYPVFMAFIGYFLEYSLNEIWLLVIISLTHSTLLTLHFFRSNFQARQSFRLDTIVSVTDKILLIIMLLVLLSRGLDLTNYVYTRFASALATLLIFYVVVVRIYGFIRPAFDFTRIKEVLFSSVPFAVMTILFSFNEKIDQVMLERMGDAVSGKLSSGLYAGAYRWLEAFQMYLWTVLPYFFARFAYYQKEPSRLQEVFNMGHIIASVPMIFVSVFVFFHAEKLFWLFDNSTPDQVEIMAGTCRILFVTSLLNGFFALYGSLLTCMGFENKLSLIVIISIGVNIILNLIFIPAYGTYAAAANTLISASIITFAYIYLVHKKLPVKIPFQILVRLVVLTVLMLLIFYALEMTGVHWYLSTFIAGTLLLLMVYMLGLVKHIRLKG